MMPPIFSAREVMILKSPPISQCALSMIGMRFWIELRKRSLSEMELGLQILLRKPYYEELASWKKAGSEFLVKKKLDRVTYDGFQRKSRPQVAPYSSIEMAWDPCQMHGARVEKRFI
jgi:hypothetical protein